MAKKAVNALIAEVAPEVEASDEKAAELMRVWERRLVNPAVAQGATITLKDPKFELHWVLTSRQGRFHQATREQGWVPVRPDELDGSISDLGLTDQKDGMVRRGPRGEEVLMKIPKGIFAKIRKRKAEVNTARIKKTKQNLAEALGRNFGDEAGEFALGKDSDSRLEKTGVSGLKDFTRTLDKDVADPL